MNSSNWIKSKNEKLQIFKISSSYFCYHQGWRHARMFGPRVSPEFETRALLGCSAAIGSMSSLRRLRTEFGGGRSRRRQWGNKRRPFSNDDEWNAKPTANISKNRQLLRDLCANLLVYVYAYKLIRYACSLSPRASWELQKIERAIEILFAIFQLADKTM